jgi:hypothetical protein
MSRGKLGFLTSLILLGVVFLNPSSVSAQLTVSGAAAGTDNIDPGAVATVTAVVDLAVPDITITWTISDDDFVRQAPVGTDFTSGGAFSNVNDVAGYKVWRDTGEGPQVIITLGSGEMSYVDDAVTNGVFYTYSVTAIDAAGNESDPVSADQVNVGSAPDADFGTTTSGDLDMGTVGLDGKAAETFSFTNNATEDDAILSLTITVDGAGFSADAEQLIIGPNGESDSFDVIFDAAEVNNLDGAYEGVLTILSNDPNNSLTVISLLATIEDGISAQRIESSSSAFPFGNVAIGTTQARTMTVLNLGDLDLSGTLALDGDAAFTIDESSFLLASSEGLTVSITFSPTGEVDYSATITITSDDPNNPELTVALSGSGSSGEEALLETDADGNLVTDDDGNFVIILGDFDGTGDVGFQDFFIFADNFGADDLTDPDVNAETDLDDSGDVGFQDFFIFADNFGKSGVIQVVVAP